MNLCEHKVRERAYYIWEDEGRSAGRAEFHWLQAEAELQAADADIEVAVVIETVQAKAPKARVSRAKSTAKPASAAKSASAAPKAVTKKATRSSRRPSETSASLH